MPRGNQKRENQLLYDRQLVAERIEDLRQGDGTDKLTFAQLSESITNATGVYISAQSLRKYENTDIDERINVNNLLAIAKYYNVSINYLLGLSDSKSNNTTEQFAAEKFGVSDDTMAHLKSLNACGKRSDERITLDLINHMLEDKVFWVQLTALVKDYKDALDNKNKMLDVSEIPVKQNKALVDKTYLTLLFGELVDEATVAIFPEKKQAPLF